MKESVFILGRKVFKSQFSAFSAQIFSPTLFDAYMSAELAGRAECAAGQWSAWSGCSVTCGKETRHNIHGRTRGFISAQIPMITGPSQAALLWMSLAGTEGYLKPPARLLGPFRCRHGGVRHPAAAEDHVLRPGISLSRYFIVNMKNSSSYPHQNDILSTFTF